MAIQTPIGILLCYGPTLFEARRNKFDPGKDPRYEGNLIFDKAMQATPEYKAMRDALKAELDDKFGNKMQDKVFVKRLKLPLKEYDKGEDGEFVLKAWTLNAPGIVDARCQDITVPGDVWSGQKARFEIVFKFFDNSGSVGVSAFLDNVQITKKDMPRIGGRQDASKAFGKVEEEGGSALDGAAEDDDMPF